MFMDASGFLSFQPRKSGHSLELFAARHLEMHCFGQIYPNPIRRNSFNRIDISFKASLNSSNQVDQILIPGRRIAPQLS